MGFTIASEAAAAIVADARARLPHEACGLLVGRGTAVARAVSAPNVAAHPERSFEIDPATLLRVHREARGQGEAVIGHYHSHPDGTSRLSKTDAARAAVDGQLWILVSKDALGGWIRTAAGFDTVELEVIP